MYKSMNGMTTIVMTADVMKPTRRPNDEATFPKTSPRYDVTLFVKSVNISSFSAIKRDKNSFCMSESRTANACTCNSLAILGIALTSDVTCSASTGPRMLKTSVKISTSPPSVMPTASGRLPSIRFSKKSTIPTKK